MSSNARTLLLSAGLALLPLAPLANGQTSYHDQTLQFHLGRYLALKPAGYRLASVDVSGDLRSHRWAAVWEQASGPDWIGGFGMSSTDFATWRVDRINEGYRDEWITSAGDGASRVYGGVMVKDGRTAWASTDLSQASFDSMVQTWSAAGFLLKSLSVHGSSQTPRYAAVWVANPENVRWGYSVGETAATHQQTFGVFVQQCWARPAVVTPSEYQRYATVYTDDEIGEWTARHDLTKAAYVSEEASLASQGYHPHQIMVGGVGSNARYAALFVRGSPASPVLTTTGTEVPELAAVDQLMIGIPGTRTDGFMQQNNVRQAGVAIARNGRLVLARGYTWAVPGHPIAFPTTLFRLASVSKTITAMAIYKLTEQHRSVTIGSRLVDMVSLGTPADPRVDQIKLFHLINHTSGYASGWPEWVVNKLQHAQNTIQSELLSFTPGGKIEYSNPGYQLLGLVCEAQSGASYFDYVSQHLWAPLGITRGSLLTTGPVSGHSRCQEGSFNGMHLLQIEPSVMLAGNPLVNSAYAASPYHGDAAGGLMMSPVDYVRLLSGVFDKGIATSVLSPLTRNALEASIQTGTLAGGWDFAEPKGPPGHGYVYYQKGGLWRSAHTYAARRTDGISIAVFCTGPTAGPIEAINDAVDAVASWPQHDLFPSYGLPAFPRLTPSSTTAYGAGCQGTNGLNVHGSAGLPEIGFQQDLLLTGGASNSTAMLLLGASKSMTGGVRLPIALGLIGAPGCSLYTDPQVVLPTVTRSSGSALVPLLYPSDPALVGVSLFSQYAVFDPPANALGLTWSNGLETVIGG